MDGILAREQEVQGLGIGKNVAAEKSQEADMPWCQGMNHCPVTKMKWRERHSPSQVLGLA